MNYLKRLFGVKERQPTEMEILWDILETNPNHEPGVQRYESAFREQGGEAAGIEALMRVARIPGSWRAQLWLGQHAMYSQQPERALALFGDCMAKVSRPVPMDVLADMSATLGSAGYFREIGELVSFRTQSTRYACRQQSDAGAFGNG